MENATPLFRVFGNLATDNLSTEERGLKKSDAEKYARWIRSNRKIAIHFTVEDIIKRIIRLNEPHDHKGFVQSTSSELLEEINSKKSS